MLPEPNGGSMNLLASKPDFARQVTDHVFQVPKRYRLGGSGARPVREDQSRIRPAVTAGSLGGSRRSRRLSRLRLATARLATLHADGENRSGLSQAVFKRLGKGSDTWY